MYGAHIVLVFVTPRVFVYVYGCMCIYHATAGIGYYKLCTFKRWSPVRNFNRLNCISVSVIPVVAPYICMIVTGCSTVPGVTKGKEGGIYVVSQPLLCPYFEFRTP